MKRIWYLLGVALVVAFGCVACRQVDIRTKTIKVAQMKNVGCEKIVTAFLAKTDGVFSEKITAGQGQVTVTYDSMKVGLRNLEFVIAEAGFDAGETPADPKARAALPSECR